MSFLRISMYTLLLLCSICSCKEKSKVIDEGFEHVQLVTGVELFDENGALIGQAGNPNNKLESFIVYPIPAGSQFAISSQKSIEKYWILSGIRNKTDYTDFDFGAQNIEYEEDQLNDLAFIHEEVTQSTLVLNVSNLNKGYYRIFIKYADGTMEWANTYLNQQLNGEDILNQVFGDF